MFGYFWVLFVMTLFCGNTATLWRVAVITPGLKLHVSLIRVVLTSQKMIKTIKKSTKVRDFFKNFTSLVLYHTFKRRQV